jgi:hypothetical protein
MQPALTTDPVLLPLLEALKPLEPLIYVANDGASRAHFEGLLAPTFWEVAASGKRYSRDYVLSELEKRQLNPFEQAWHTTDYHLQQVASDLYLLHYILHQPTRVTQRSSLWKQCGSHWQLMYHQGTVS